MKTFNRVIAAAAASILVFSGAGALSNAAELIPGTGIENPIPQKDADQLNWGHKDLPTSSQLLREVKEGKRPQCTAAPAGNRAVGQCVNHTDTTYYAAVTTTCFVNSANGASNQPASASFVIPPHSTRGASVACPAGSFAQGASINGPLTKHESDIARHHPLETIVKGLM